MCVCLGDGWSKSDGQEQVSQEGKTGRGREDDHWRSSLSIVVDWTLILVTSVNTNTAWVWWCCWMCGGCCKLFILLLRSPVLLYKLDKWTQLQLRLTWFLCVRVCGYSHGRGCGCGYFNLPYVRRQIQLPFTIYNLKWKVTSVTRHSRWWSGQRESLFSSLSLDSWPPPLCLHFPFSPLIILLPLLRLVISLSLSAELQPNYAPSLRFFFGHQFSLCCIVNGVSVMNLELALHHKPPGHYLRRDNCKCNVTFYPFKLNGCHADHEDRRNNHKLLPATGSVNPLSQRVDFLITVILNFFQSN